MPFLFEWIKDERNLRAAWDHLRAYGGQSPGPNGLRYADLAEREVWSLLRCLRDAIGANSYRLGPVRKIRLRKLSGSGFRTITLQNLEDRVVARAIVQIIQPLLDVGFDPCSFGFRPGRCRMHALAAADAITVNQGLACWIVDDVKDAFNKVPRGRLLDVLRMRLPDTVTRLIEVVMATQSKRGIRQGSPLSPLLLNLYLDHFLDKPWRQRHPGTPLIRSADDIVICCSSVAQARRAYADLHAMMTAAGMPLKGNADTAIVGLSNEQSANWLGYRVSLAADGLACQIADRAWPALEQRLAHAHSKPCSPLVADKIARGWISQLGPCFRHEDTGDACTRLRSVAADLAFDEIPSHRELAGLWRASFNRWQAIRDNICLQ